MGARVATLFALVIALGSALHTPEVAAGDGSAVGTWGLAVHAALQQPGERVRAEGDGWERLDGLGLVLGLAAGEVSGVSPVQRVLVSRSETRVVADTTVGQVIDALEEGQSGVFRFGTPRPHATGHGNAAERVLWEMVRAVRVEVGDDVPLVWEVVALGVGGVVRREGAPMSASALVHQLTGQTSLRVCPPSATTTAQGQCHTHELAPHDTLQLPLHSELVATSRGDIGVLVLVWAVKPQPQPPVRAPAANRKLETDTDVARAKAPRPLLGDDAAGGGVVQRDEAERAFVGMGVPFHPPSPLHPPAHQTLPIARGQSDAVIAQCLEHDTCAAHGLDGTLVVSSCACDSRCDCDTGCVGCCGCDGMFGFGHCGCDCWGPCTGDCGCDGSCECDECTGCYQAEQLRCGERISGTLGKGSLAAFLVQVQEPTFVWFTSCSSVAGTMRLRVEGYDRGVVLFDAGNTHGASGRGGDCVEQAQSVEGWLGDGTHAGKAVVVLENTAQVDQGYSLSFDGCSPNECATDNGGCDDLTVCTDSPTGALCSQCPRGYPEQPNTQVPTCQSLSEAIVFSTATFRDAIVSHAPAFTPKQRAFVMHRLVPGWRSLAHQWEQECVRVVPRSVWLEPAAGPTPRGVTRLVRPLEVSRVCDGVQLTIALEWDEGAAECAGRCFLTIQSDVLGNDGAVLFASVASVPIVMRGVFPDTDERDGSWLVSGLTVMYVVLALGVVVACASVVAFVMCKSNPPEPRRRRRRPKHRGYERHHDEGSESTPNALRMPPTPLPGEHHQYPAEPSAPELPPDMLPPPGKDAVGWDARGGAQARLDRLCPICMDRERDCVLDGCGHTLCRQCADHLRSTTATCHVCRAKFDCTHPFYL